MENVHFYFPLFDHFYIDIYSQQNISDVITDIRIETACNLLKNTNLSLKEISAKVGYSNQYYFSSCFKKKTGQTPSSYR